MADLWAFLTKANVRVFGPEIARQEIEFVAAHMRDADRQELAACSGRTPLDALMKAVPTSILTGVVYRRDTPCAIFGTKPLSLIEGIGSPWVLGTDAMYGDPSVLTRLGRWYLAAVQEQFPRLVNFVDARNTRAVTWLEHIGFELGDAAPHGVAGLPFHRLEMGPPNV